MLFCFLHMFVNCLLAHNKEIKTYISLYRKVPITPTATWHGFMLRHEAGRSLLSRQMQEAQIQEREEKQGCQDATQPLLGQEARDGNPAGG